jgi:hypothetical protein
MPNLIFSETLPALGAGAVGIVSHEVAQRSAAISPDWDRLRELDWVLAGLSSFPLSRTLRRDSPLSSMTAVLGQQLSIVP